MAQKTDKTQKPDKTQKGTQTWGEVIARDIYYNALPLSRNGKSLDGGAMASLIMLQVDYARAAGEFEARMQDALAKLKKEKCPDYDTEVSKKPEERREGFADDESALIEAYRLLRIEEASRPYPDALRSISSGEFAAVCSLGADGDVALANPQRTQLPLAELLKYVAMTIDR